MHHELANLLSHQAWLMHERTATVLYHLLTNGKIDLAAEKLKTNEKIAALYPGMHTEYIGTYSPSRRFQHKSGQNVAIMPIFGTLTKRGDFCGYGMRDYMGEIMSLNKNEEIAAIVLDMEGPGGSVDGIKELGMAIAQSAKPVICFGDNMVASAHFWLASQCDFIIGNANNPTEFGSIGTLCVHEYWGKYIAENIGEIKIIRAAQSVDKARVNPIEPLSAELEAEIVADLTSLATEFHNTVKAGRGDRLKASEQEWGTGKMFKNAEAIALGLIDGEGTIMDAIDKAVELSASIKKATPTPSTNAKNMTVKDAAKKVSSFFTKKSATAKAAEGEPAAAEDTTPMWTKDMTFNTDGSGDGAFCLHADSSGKDRKFETKIDNNIGNEPPTDEAVTEDDNWAVVVEEAAAPDEEAAAPAATTVMKLNAALKASQASVKALTDEVAQLKQEKAGMQAKLDATPAGKETKVIAKSDKGVEYAGKPAVNSWEKKAAKKVGIAVED